MSSSLSAPSNITSNLGSTTSSALPQQTLSSADFIQLMNVQFQEQDPMKPMDDSAFLAQMAQFATLDYAAFTASLPDPAHLCLFKAEPLAGVGVLDLDPHLALSCADRMLGGRGQVLPGGRLLTEIEVALIDDIATIILEDWTALWRPVQELRTSIIGHENSGRFLQTSPREAIMLVATFEAVFGEITRRIQLGIPCHSIEHAVRRLQASPRGQEAAAKAAPAKAAWRGGAYDQITIPARAEWHIFDLPLREVAALRVGDTLELPTALLDQTELVLADAPKFLAKVGLEGDHVALQLTRAISRSQPAAPHAHPH